MSDRAAPGILVVEPQADLRALLQTLLRHHGFRVLLAASGREALPILRSKTVEVALVLLEAAMPDWDGPRTLAELRQFRPDLPAAFIAGDSWNAARDALPVAAVIRKPFEPSELARTLWTVVGDNDRRDAPRAVAQSTRVAVGAGFEPHQVVESYVGDHSRDGLRLRLTKRLGEVGAILSIRPADNGDDSPWVPVQVRHMSSESGMWTVGCQFLHPAASLGR